MKVFITVDKAVFRSFPLPKQNRLIELAIDLRQDEAANLLRWWQQTDKRTEPASHLTPASTGMENVEHPQLTPTERVSVAAADERRLRYWRNRQ